MTLSTPSRPARSGRTLERFFAVLTTLVEAGRPVSAAELAEGAGLPLSSTYRLVQALERHGFVERRPRGTITLGLRVLELASHVEDRLRPSLLEPAGPVMQELAHEHGETVLLTAPIGASSIGLASVDSPRPIRLAYARWRLAPLTRGASGKVLLAHLDDEWREQVLGATNDGIDVDALRDELAQIRRCGYAVSTGELDEGASGVAAPVFDAWGRLVAGLTIAGPTERIRPTEHELARAVVAAARTLGGSVAPLVR